MEVTFITLLMWSIAYVGLLSKRIFTDQKFIVINNYQLTAVKLVYQLDKLGK